ncbi:MAG: TetR/AcrR family transcriptional regulator [Thiobacillus sp.]|nr:TetR/AcrR family transcriptional regulator [Thiobacillus sp.]
MARRSDHSREEIRQMALNAAEAIVAAEGYKGLSARKVATAIDYTVGTLYLVFENLDDLVLQVNGRTLDALYEWLRARQVRGAKEADARDSLLAIADAYIAYAETETPRWNMLFEYVAEQGNELPDWYLVKLSRVFGLAEAALKPLADHRTELEIQQAARVLWAAVHGICTLKIRHRMDLVGGQSAGEMARMLIDNFLQGFQA